MLIVDKPSGMTSHDVVSRVRRTLRMKRVGHAGTLDPMATGVLVVGAGRATRLLGHLALGDKDYDAGIRLGVTTDTDDAEGTELTRAEVTCTPADVVAAAASLTGVLSQIPPAYSAIKVDGQRSYARARSGETVELAARTVTVSRFEITSVSGADVTALVTCSSGTYVRSLARDLGAKLGVGGHLSSLCRTRVGPFGLAQTVALDDLMGAGNPVDFLTPMADAVAAGFRRRDLTDDEVVEIGFGRPLEPTGIPGVHGVFAPDGRVLALVEDRDGRARPVVVFEPQG